MPINTDINLNIASGLIENNEDMVFEGLDITFTTDDGDAINNILDNEINLYPNPAQKYITVTGAKNAVVNIYGITGKLVLNKNIDSDNKLIDISNLPCGVYVAKITKNNISTERKITIVK